MQLRESLGPGSGLGPGVKPSLISPLSPAQLGVQGRCPGGGADVWGTHFLTLLELRRNQNLKPDAWCCIFT